MNNKVKIVNKFSKDRATGEALFTDIAKTALGEIVIVNDSKLPAILIKDNNMETHELHPIAIKGNADTSLGDIKVANENKNGESVYTIAHGEINVLREEETVPEDNITILTDIVSNPLGHITKIKTGKISFKTINDEVANIREDITGLTESIGQVESTVSANTESINALNASVSANTESIGQVESDINALKGIVGTPAIDETEATGLVKEVADLKAEVEAIEIPEVPVQDVTVGGVSVLNENGVAEIVIPEIPEVPVQDVKVNGKTVLDEDGVAEIEIPDVTIYETIDNVNEVRKDVSANTESINTLKGIVGTPAIDETEATGLVKEVADLKAEVEAIEIPEVPVQDVTVDGVSVLNKETGIAEIVMPEIPDVPVQDVTVDGVSVLNENGVAEIVMPEIPDVTIYETIDNVNEVREDVSANTESIRQLESAVSANTESINTLKNQNLNTVTYGDAIEMVDGVINVKVQNDSNNYLKISDNNELTVDSINTVDTFISEEITIAGGPLADLAKQVYTGGTVPQGISIQEFLINLLCQEIYPTATTTTGSFSIYFNSKPSISNTNDISNGGCIKVGSSITFNKVTALSVTTSTTQSHVSGLDYGYSDTIDGEINTDKSIYGSTTVSQKSGSVYTLTASKNNFEGTLPTNVSNATASSCQLNTCTLTTVLGTNTYTVTETGPTYDYTIGGIGEKFIVSNLGNRNENKKSDAIAEVTSTKSPSSTSTTFTVTGVYPVYTNIGSTQNVENLETEIIGSTSSQTTFEVSYKNDVAFPCKFAFPGDRTATVQLWNPTFSTWGDVDAANSSFVESSTLIINNIKYSVWTYTGNRFGGEAKFKFTLSKKISA